MAVDFIDGPHLFSEIDCANRLGTCRRSIGSIYLSPRCPSPSRGGPRGAGTMASETRTSSRRFIGKCHKSCGAALAVDTQVTTVREYGRDGIRVTASRSMARFSDGTSQQVWNGRVSLPCTKCSRSILLSSVCGIVTEHKCGAKCLNSKGHVCECSCGGKNHGAGYLAVAS